MEQYVHDEERQAWRLEGNEKRPDMNSLCCYLRPCDALAHTSTKYNVWVHSSTAERDSVPMSVAHVAHVTSKGCRHPWSGLPPEAMLMSESCTELALPLTGYSTRDHRPTPYQGITGPPLIGHAVIWAQEKCPTYLPLATCDRWESRPHPLPR